MKEWQVRQEIYHRLNRSHPDEYGPDDIEMMFDQSNEAVATMVCEYMRGMVPEKVIYPAKSYFVALVYARLLRDNFGEDPNQMLTDPNLLYGNDPYYKTYWDNPEIYDNVLRIFGWDFDLTLGEIPDVQNYFNTEFGIS